MVTFNDELDFIEGAEAAPLDFEDVKHEAVRLADSGIWDVRLTCPDGRKRTVKQVVKQFELARYLCPEAA